MYLHMELVQMLLGTDPNPTTTQLQTAGRKLEAVGFQVGQRLVERYTKERPRFSDTLEIIKFICKDFWFEVYRKQIDKLQTNNRVRHPPARPIDPTPGADPWSTLERRRGCTCCKTTSTGCSRAARRAHRRRRVRSRWGRCTPNTRQVSSAALSAGWESQPP